MNPEREAILAIVTNGDTDSILAFRPTAESRPEHVLLWVAHLLGRGGAEGFHPETQMFADFACIATVRHLDSPASTPVHLRRSALDLIDRYGLREALEQWRGILDDGEPAPKWEALCLESYDVLEVSA